MLRKESWKQNKQKPCKAANNLKGESIDNRPTEANERLEYGHWEMDLIVSGKGALLTLTERKFRQETIIRLPDKTQRAVKRTKRRRTENLMLVGAILPCRFGAVVLEQQPWTENPPLLARLFFMGAYYVYD
ncbi:MAG: hypothetical protein LBI38_00485 [Oscillospiraceae bacterium]|nr:hypothetical protein [Oscillospiraceae bacterium]